MTATLTPSSAPASTPAQPRRPNGWLVLGGIVTAAVLVLGTLTAAGWIAYRTETTQQVYQHPITELAIDIGTGDVTLTAGTGGTVSLTRRTFWSFTRPTAQERWEGSTLRIDSDCQQRPWLPGPRCGVDYTLQVPTGIDVRVRSSTGDITVRNIDGYLQLETDTGDVTVSGASGALLLHTDTGDIDATDVTSSTVEVATDTGDITIGLQARPRHVAATTDTGNILVVVPDSGSYQVLAEADTGDVTVSVRRDDTASASITARTDTGDIDVQYP